MTSLKARKLVLEFLLDIFVQVFLFSENVFVLKKIIYQAVKFLQNITAEVYTLKTKISKNLTPF